MLTAHVHSGPVGHRHIQPGHIGRQSLTRCGDIHSAQGATFFAPFLISKINWTQTVHSTNARAYTSFRVPIETGLFKLALADYADWPHEQWHNWELGGPCK